MPDQKKRRRGLPRRTVALVLAGGRGSRLHELTTLRAKPAVHFGGKYRIVDFALSNCVNSGIRRIYVATQYKSHSLLRHIQRGWNVLQGERNEFIDLLPAQQRIDEETWYRGTTDAVFQNLDILRDEGPDYIVVLAGDHIYKMDYNLMLADHVAHGADVSVGCVKVPCAEASAFGVMQVDEEGFVTRFLEKPAEPPSIPGDEERCLASMGIYVFGADFLYHALEGEQARTGTHHDFGGDLIPGLVERAKVYAHSLDKSAVLSDVQAKPYWRDVGTLDAFWEANIDLTAVTPALDIYDKRWPIFTYRDQLPPAKFVFDDDDRRGVATDSLVASGCVVSGAHVDRSVLFNEVRCHSYAQVHRSVIFPKVDIARGARLTKAIVDRGCEIPQGLVVGEDPEQDARRFRRSAGGVVLITAEMLARL
ncbi:MAG: glucose-1-phosphate adenylyltransferase [Deltaproteobacteria bacterium]|nr:glucose-1-phosphate adenylyltransferase [Deltaproteobacteria bacterium]